MSSKVQFGKLPTVAIASGAFAKLSPSAQAVYVVLVCHSGDWHTTVGRELIMEESGCKAKSTVTRALRELQDAGLIIQTRRGGRDGKGGRGYASTYVIATTINGCDTAPDSGQKTGASPHPLSNKRVCGRTETGARDDVNGCRVAPPSEIFRDLSDGDAPAARPGGGGGSRSPESSGHAAVERRLAEMTDADAADLLARASEAVSRNTFLADVANRRGEEMDANAMRTEGTVLHAKAIELIRLDGEPEAIIHGDHDEADHET